METRSGKRRWTWCIGPVAAAAGLAAFGWWQLAPPTTTVCLLGDVRTRAAGEVSTPERERHIDARPIVAGFGGAAIGGWESLGDALAVGGEVYLRTTHAASPNYFRVVRNRYFQSNNFVYLRRDARPSDELAIDRPTDLGSLWSSLAERYPDGVLVEGYLWLEPFNAIAIAHPAIDGGAIDRQAARYYTQPMETAARSWVYTVGVAAALSRPSWRGDHDTLVRAVRRNPDARYDGSAHGLRLREAPAAPGAAPDPAMVESLGELLPSSIATRGRLRLYALEGASNCD